MSRLSLTTLLVAAFLVAGCTSTAYTPEPPTPTPTHTPTPAPTATPVPASAPGSTDERPYDPNNTMWR
ncbi:MAG: hypothetical protein OXK21_04885, partial [Chloroflexota bacterium]|nr:hypothetical protein [Chloroflexota bacterium]